MALTRDQIDDLAEEDVFLGNVYEIARAIEAEVRKDDEALIRQLVEALEQSQPYRDGNEIAASDKYFSARPQIVSADRRKVFQAGFERGWDAALAAKKGGKA